MRHDARRRGRRTTEYMTDQCSDAHTQLVESVEKTVDVVVGGAEAEAHPQQSAGSAVTAPAETPHQRVSTEHSRPYADAVLAAEPVRDAGRVGHGIGDDADARLPSTEERDPLRQRGEQAAL